MPKKPAPDRNAVTDAARATLPQAGYRILDRDWDTGDGHHLDFVAEAPGRVLTAVWVLAPSRVGTQGRAQAMAKSHIRRLRQAAVAWAAAHGLRYSVIQVDVFGVDPDGRPVHVKAVR